MSRHSYSSLCFRYFLVCLCISIVIIQLSQADGEDLFSSSIENNNGHPLNRRNSDKVVKMLQQILRRGEMQVEPYRIHEYLHRLHRRQANN